MNIHDLIGLEVANDGSGLRKALEAHYQIESLTHIGDFVFRAEMAGGDTLTICTEPVDQEMRTLKIVGVSMGAEQAEPAPAKLTGPGDRPQLPAQIIAELKVTLTGQDIDDIMVDALEGGITYWCGAAVVPDGKYLGEYASDQISRGGSLILYDRESDDKWELTLEKFLRGVKLYLEQEKDAGRIIDHGKLNAFELDACVADAIIQYALFGEIVFA